jgi:bacterioferritin-associated ferredoxin
LIKKVGIDLPEQNGQALPIEQPQGESHDRTVPHVTPVRPSARHVAGGSPVIVCHCTNISDHEIRSDIDWMRAADPDTIITPGKVYRALGKKAECGGCLPLFMSTMENSPHLGVPAELRGLRRMAGAGR